MSLTASQANSTACFVDLATFSELEAFLYGGSTAITIFVKGLYKANWHSHIPIQLRSQGNFDFGARNAQAILNRSVDYITATWARLLIPQVEIPDDAGIYTDSWIRWTRNLGHNVFEKVQLAFNELVVEEFDSHWLDINTEFRLPESKRVGYNNMIGNVAAYTAPVGPGVALGLNRFLTVPLPWYYSEDTGFALPIAAIPFNEVTVRYYLRTLEQLLIVFGGTGGGTTPATVSSVVVYGTGAVPSITTFQTWVDGDVVHNDERVKMGDAPRDMLITQVQNMQAQPFKDVTSPSTFDLRFSHAVIQLFWMAENYTIAGDNSNYTTNFDGTGSDPIATSTLLYDNTVRLAMDSDYFNWTLPFYLERSIPPTGYHGWSYAYKPWFFDYMTGSTDYSKLANVSLTHEMSDSAINSADASPVDDSGAPLTFPPDLSVADGGVLSPQKYRHIVQVQNANVQRINNGSVSFPIL